MNKAKLLLISIGLLFYTFPYTQESAQVVPESTQNTGQSDLSDFTFSADSTSAVLAEGKESTVLQGNVELISDQTQITADRIQLFGTDFRYARCQGNITIFDTEQGFLVRCQTMFFDREDEFTRISGYAEMEDQKNSLIVKGFYLENNGIENYTTIQIGVRILKIDGEDEMVCRSEYAHYNRDTDILNLSGLPEVTWNQDEYRASHITINLDTDEIFLDGEVSGTIINNSGETTSEEEPAPTEEPAQATQPDPATGEDAAATQPEETQEVL